MSFKEVFKDEYIEIDISNNEEAKAFFEENVYKREREILKKSDGLFKCIKEGIVMGEIAEMMLGGVLCASCGVFLDVDGNGYPEYCEDCQEQIIEEDHR
ncbi:hypothetical protein [Enterococcus faecalis]|uniref:hypothetical protein n=1 Tax=Enterococcus faecalis TaxID=1351 RepID=UPI003F3D5720